MQAPKPAEYRGIEAEVFFDESINRKKFPGKQSISLFDAQNVGLVSPECSIKVFQQFNLEIRASSPVRRVPCIYRSAESPSLCGLFFIVGAIIGGLGGSLRTNKPAGWAGIAFIYIYGINFTYSFAPIGRVPHSEIFNLVNRLKAMAITASTTSMCNFTTPRACAMMLNTGHDYA
ncbi:low-affinity glucose transporter HXT3 [Colletotrichum higginsianum]|uniref:Low-affinity glucose transporter HXT3 n=1 Tax=Colletotrichum higginsianum (strain IMI 349063) TaxID=759273 RepID=H1W082_COLHI|nr:low-affinity glucose transporter HXT3 [Colletotrichum higginsianum]